MTTPSPRLLSGTLAALLLASGVLIPSAVPSATAVEHEPNGSVNEPYPKVPVGVPLVGNQYTAHRSYLRPGCRWDVFGRGLQHCQVYSRAMKQSIPVEILPAKTAGNPRIIMALDGLNDNNKHNGFVFAGNMQARLVNYDVTLVAPISGDYAAGTYYTDYVAPMDSGKNLRWETFLVRELPAYLEWNFQVPNRRKSTALVGLSMGSVGILNLAQRFPQRYTAVNAMSGFYTLSRPLRAGVLAVGSQMVGYQPRRMWGPWPTGQWRAHDPSLNITRYTMPVRASCGNGTSLTGVEPPPFAVVAEVASHMDTEDFQKMVAFAPNRKNFTFRIANKGAHNWAFWEDDLYHHGGFTFLLRSLGLLR